MPTSDAVRDAQRRLKDFDAAYQRGLARLRQAEERRAEVLAEHDRGVAAARDELSVVVASMAEEIGESLTACVLGIELAEVRTTRRRLKKVRPRGEPDR